MTDKYFEPLINYDLNGNITQYERRGITTGTTYGQIDLMVYTYDATNPDRLSRIADLAPSANRPFGFKPKGVPSYYGYDNAGNMTSDGHKDLTVAYNALNLPDVFTFANVTPNNKIEIVYNAAGEKLEKQVYTGATLSLHKRYVMGIEYTGTTLEAIYHAEGRIVPIGGGVFRYEYTLKDHLGNSRVSFAANGTAIQLLQENHYYPFGMEMKGAWIAQSGTENGYQYNGKELNEDWGLNWSDYGARWYDASIGRWNSVDPLAEKYGSISAYVYVANNPNVYIDPNGMELYLAKNKNAKQAMADILDLVNSAKFDGKVDFRFTETEKGTKVDVDFSKLDSKTIEGDAGLSLLKNVTSSSKSYLYEISETASSLDRETGNEVSYQMGISLTQKGSLGLNFSKTDRGDKPLYEIPLFENPHRVFNGIPRNNFDVHVVISPNAGDAFKQNIKGEEKIPRAWFTFHEMLESYYRTDKGQSLKDAHVNALANGQSFYLITRGWDQTVNNPYAPTILMSEVRMQLEQKKKKN